MLPRCVPEVDHVTCCSCSTCRSDLSVYGLTLKVCVTCSSMPLTKLEASFGAGRAGWSKCVGCLAATGPKTVRPRNGPEFVGNILEPVAKVVAANEHRGARGHCAELDLRGELTIRQWFVLAEAGPVVVCFQDATWPFSLLQRRSRSGSRCSLKKRSARKPARRALNREKAPRGQARENRRLLGRLHQRATATYRYGLSTH